MVGKIAALSGVRKKTFVSSAQGKADNTEAHTYESKSTSWEDQTEGFRNVGGKIQKRTLAEKHSNFQYPECTI